MSSLDGTVVVALEDSGLRPHANGRVIRDANGRPAAYVVAEGDALSSIAERLCTLEVWLGYLNQVRRGQTSGSEPVVYVGDTLNLDPHTITSVGDINGSVHDYPPSMMDPLPLPPQR